jgi:hypothetical protein
MPVEKSSGSTVYAGTINQSGALEIGADKLGRDTTFGRIIEAVERAEKSRAPIQKTADRLAGYLVYFALGCRSSHLHHHSQYTVEHFGCNCCRSLWHRPQQEHLSPFWERSAEPLITARSLKAASTSKPSPGWTGCCSTKPHADFRNTTDSGCSLRRRFYRTRDSDPRRHCGTQVRTSSRQSNYCTSERPGSTSCRTRPFRLHARKRSHSELPRGRNCRRQPYAPHGTRGEKDPTCQRSWRRGASEVYVAKAGRVLGTIRIADVLRPEAKSVFAAMREMGLKTILLSGDAQEVNYASGTRSRRRRSRGRAVARSEGAMGHQTSRKES